MNTTHRINALNTLRPLVLAVTCLAAGASWAQVTVVVGPAPTVVDPVVAARQQEMALQLARANLSQQGITEPSIGQLALATSDVQAQRDSGMGWGQIANSLGLRLGSVVSAANQADQADRRAGLAIGTRTTRPAAAGSKANAGNSGNSNAGGQGAGSSGNRGGGASAGGGSNAGGGGNAGGKGGNSGNGGGGNGGGKGGGNGGGKR